MKKLIPLLLVLAATLPARAQDEENNPVKPARPITTPGIERRHHPTDTANQDLIMQRATDFYNGLPK